MNKLLLLIFAFHYCLVLRAQNATPYALWQDDSTNQYYFVRINAATGVKSNIAAIPGLSFFVAGSATAYNSDHDYYHFAGMENTTQRFYTIDVFSGNVIYNPVLSDIVVGIEYNCNDSTLYGIRVIGNTYDLVTIDPVTGTFTSITALTNMNAYVAESFTLDLRQSLYSFVALSAPSYYLRSYSIPGGTLVYDKLFPDNLTAYHYSCTDSAVYALWENGINYNLRKVDPATGTHTLAGVLTGVVPGYTTESSVINSFGEYVYRGFNSNNDFSLITIDISTGTVISVVPTTDNAVGFEEGICCYDTSGTVSVYFPDVENNISIYPNPVADELQILFKNDLINSVRITDATGRVLLEKEVNAEMFVQKLDVAKGIYFVEVRSAKQTFLRKIVKL